MRGAASPLRGLVRLALVLVFVLPFPCACTDDGAREADRATEAVERLPVIQDASALLQTRFTHDKAGSFEKHLPETMAGGGGFFDYDGDGDLDAYLVQSGNYPGRTHDQALTNVLLRQEADGTFVDVTAHAGVGDAGYGFGCQAADVDNDGDQDLFVTNYGPNVFYRNRGDGTFADESAASGLADPRWATSAAFFDADNDGFLDLYVVNYLRYDASVARECFAADNRTRSYCSPTLFEGEDDVLYLNRAGRGFEDVSARAGILGPRGKGLGVVAADLDQDGLVDVIVANDTTPTLLFRNRGPVEGVPRLEEDALMSEIARSKDGVARAGMGIDVADVDGDLLLDVVITNFSAEVNALYLGRDGGAWFDERSLESGFGAPSFPFLGFGVVLFDAEADGEPDALVANGHVLDTIDRTSGATSYRQRPLLLRSAGGRWTDLAPRLGPLFTRGYTGRGLAVGDFDGDLDADFLLLQVEGRPLLLRNDSARAGRVLALHLVGTRSNRDAIGALVRVEAAGRTWLHTIVGGRSYLSMHDRTLLIGLGAVERVERVEIRWPSGLVESLDKVPLDRRLVVEEGRGIVVPR